MSRPRPSQPLEAALALQEPFLQRLARALVQDENSAADLVQDTVAAALTHVNSKDSRGRRARLESLPPEGLRGWLGAVLRNTRTDRARASRRARTAGPEALGTLPGQVDSPDGIAQRLERQQLLHGALMSLPEVQRTALVLRYQDGRTIQQIADACGSPVPTVKSRLHRGLGLLKDELQRRSGGEEGSEPRWLAAMAALAHPPTPAITGHSIPAAWNFTMGKTAPVLLFAALVGGAAVLFFTGRERHSAEAHGGAAVAVAPEAVAPAGRVLSAGGRMDRQIATVEGLSAAGAAEKTRPPIVGTVVSAMSGEPVAALVQWTGGPQTRANLIQGGFLLEPVPGVEPMLRLEHPRFEALEWPIPEWEPAGRSSQDTTQNLGVIELMPASEARVQVVNELGHPVEGARCTLHRRLTQVMDGRGPGPGDLDRPRPLGETDDAGILAMPLAFPATVAAVAPDGRMGVAQARAGETAVVQLDGPARTLTALDHGSGEPIVGRAFPMSWQRGASAVGLFLWTDAEGKAPLPVGAGRLVLCKSEPRLLLESMTAGERSIAGIKSGSFTASDQLAEEETEVIVGVADHERILRLVDAVTGDPIDGEAYCQLNYMGDNGERRGPGADTIYPVVAGAMTVHSWFAEPMSAERSDGSQRWIAIPGYEVCTVAADVDLVGATVQMQPASQRRLRMLDVQGNPKPGLLVLELAPGQVIRHRFGVDGLTSPFPWVPGQSWRFLTQGSSYDDGWQTITSERLEAEEIVVLQDESELGRIHILGAPDGSLPLFASTKNGVPVPALAVEPGVLEIRGLAPGDYVVGPKAWVQQIAKRFQQPGGFCGGDPPTDRSMDELLVPVAPDNDVEVAWDPRWGLTTSVAGQVHCKGFEGRQLAVLPIYGKTGTSIYFGPRTPWIYCDASGRFQTQSGDPEPVAFLFASFEYGSFGRKPVILDSQRVREDGQYSIAVTSYELVATNAEEWAADGVPPRSRPTVWNQSSTQYLDAPMDYLHGRGHSGWNPAEPLVAHGLPCNVHELKIAFHGKVPDIQVEVVPGGHKRIEVHVPIPAAKAAGGGAATLMESR